MFSEQMKAGKSLTGLNSRGLSVDGWTMTRLFLGLDILFLFP